MSSLPAEVEQARRRVLEWNRGPDLDPLRAVRAWPRLAAAVAAAGRAGGLVDPNEHLERAAAQVVDIERGTQGWPGDRTPDPVLEDVAGRLERAARGAREPLRSEEQMSVRFGLASIGAVVNHAQYQAVTIARINARMTPDRDKPDVAATARAAGETARRINAATFTTTAMHLGSLAGADSSHQVRDVSEALSAWDRQAMKTLQEDSSTLSLYAVATTETTIARGYLDAVGRAHQLGAIDSVELSQVSDQAVQRAGAWHRLSEVAKPMATGGWQGVETAMMSHAAARSVTSAVLTFEPEDARGVLHALSLQASASSSAVNSIERLVETGELRAPARTMTQELKAAGLDPVATGVPMGAQVRSESAPMPAVLVDRFRDNVADVKAATDAFIHANVHLGSVAASSSPIAAAFPRETRASATGPTRAASTQTAGRGRDSGWGRD